jgi:hypothetical protein
MSEQILTVAQLIVLLSSMPPDAYVRIEGCDCYGWAASVEPGTPVDEYDANFFKIDKGSPTCLIERHE